MTNLYLVPFTRNAVLAITLFTPTLLLGQQPFEPSFNFKSGPAGTSLTMPGHQAQETSGIDTLHLTPQLTENLVVIGKIWGFLKYYHPAVARGKYNWDEELFRLLPRVLEVKSTAKRDKMLTDWIDSLGKVVPGKDEIRPKGNVKLLPDLKWIEHSGFSSALISCLTRILNAERGTEHYYVELVQGIGGARFKNEVSYSKMKYPDTGFRLLCLYRYWNYIQYYFPYKYLIDDDWNDILSAYIPIFSTASNELEYKLAILSLITTTDDSHAVIRSQEAVLENYWGTRWSSLKLSFIENKVVVTGYFDKARGEKTGLLPGDVIERINGAKVEEIIEKRLPFTPGSNYTARMRNLVPGLLRTRDSTIKIDYRNDQAKHSANLVSYPFSVFDSYKKHPEDTCFKLLKPEIAYLDGGTLKSAYLPVIMDVVLSTDGLIIDMRTYPQSGYVYDLCQFLLAKPRNFFRISIASLSSPGMFTMSKKYQTFGKYKRRGYKGKVIILVNEFTQSAAEFNTMAFQAVPGAIVVGSQTAGADGNVTRFNLPGGIETAFSSIGIYYPDGTETQRVGIVPDIEVKPTIEGIREGRDEVLEAAVKLITSEGTAAGVTH